MEKTKEKILIKEQLEDFGTLYTRYVTKIYKYVLFRVPGKQTAEDITHEVFLSAWKNIKKYKIIEKRNPKADLFLGWLYKMARNKIIDYYRKDKKEVSIDSKNFDISLAGYTEQDDLDKKFVIDKIKSLIEFLIPEYKKIITMRYIRDMEYGEMAKELGKTTNSVGVIHHRAINQIKKLHEKNKNN